MATHGQNFANQTLLLDGSHFEDCTFDSCVFAFFGTAPFVMRGCKLRRYRFSVTYGAHRTLRLLGELLHGEDEAERSRAERLVDAILDGEPIQDPLSQILEPWFARRYARLTCDWLAFLARVPEFRFPLEGVTRMLRDGSIRDAPHPHFDQWVGDAESFSGVGCRDEHSCEMVWALEFSMSLEYRGQWFDNVRPLLWSPRALGGEVDMLDIASPHVLPRAFSLVGFREAAQELYRSSTQSVAPLFASGDAADSDGGEIRVLLAPPRIVRFPSLS